MSAANHAPAAEGAPRRLTVALAGNPNAGKTTLFNRLTGARQHVGNYPGVTVEKKEGSFRHRDCDVTVVDLPGTYSLSACSLDEVVARDFVIHAKPDLVVDVVDASNLERHLYLSVQFMELGVPMILVFNMSDLADRAGHVLDTGLLSRLLGVRIVRTVGPRGEGIAELREAIVDFGARPQPPGAIRYGREIEAEVDALTTALGAPACPLPDLSPRWVALKLLEGDEQITALLRARLADPAPILNATAEALTRIEKHFGDRADTVIADQRYGFISGACQEATRRTVELRHSLSDRVDDILISRVLGLPIFLFLMYLVFRLTFSLGDPLAGTIEAAFHWLGNAAAAVWPGAPDSPWLSLIRDGVISGVGGVVMFLPNIVFLFAAIAVLEDSGYMARAAFIMDQWMHRIGLHGKSFIPLLIGFGCTVPAIMATRVLENRRDRMTTMLVLPLISCGARFPIYTMLIAAFFPPAWRTFILMCIYLLGVAMALLLAKLLRESLFRGDEPLFVMELPPYRLPTVQGILLHTWERGWLFLRKAGTVVLAISVILWALTTYPRLPREQLEGLTPEAARSASLSHSLAGRMGHAMAPVMRPVGFDWKATTALIGAFAAKEVFVAQMSIIHSLGEADVKSQSLGETLRREYTPLQAVCMMLFCLITMPCVMTVAATARESGAWRWAVAQAVGLTALAYVVTLLVYQSGRLFAWLA